MNREEHITLQQLQDKIKGVIETNVADYYWIRAEISDIKNHGTGHCYLDLIDKKEDQQHISAKAHAIIWSSSYRLIRPYFETTTGTQLLPGIHILVKVQVQYSPVYGLTLVITDIDPSYTIGEAELQRQKCISKLKEEGMFEMNKTLELAILPKRLAIISSESAAGYLDFIKHLHENEYGFKFKTDLFTSPMQGVQAPLGIIQSMDKVASLMHNYDALLILRGGGSSQDLSCFDDYELAVNIAQFPLPVLTGIGHEQDFHIADMVAHTSVKTPTALADYFIEIFGQEDMQITFLARRLSLSLQTRISNEKSNLNRLSDKVVNSVKTQILNRKHSLEILEQRVLNNNTNSLLNKGYAIVSRNGERVFSALDVEIGSQIKVMLMKGTLLCSIISKENE